MQASFFQKSEIKDAAYRVLGEHWKVPENKSRLDLCIRAVQRKEKKFARAIAGNQRQKARARQFHMEHSLAARICSFLLAYPKGGKTLTWDQMIAEAKKLSLRSWSGEPVKAYAKEKPEGGFRTICMFGPRWRGADYLADFFLAMRLGRPQHAYLQKGRGREAAIKAIINEVRNGGARKFIQADVKSCFSSFNPEAIGAIPGIPKAMVNCLAIPKEATVIPHKVAGSPLPDEFAVRAGIPHGLRSSTRLVNWALEEALAPLGIQFFFYGDDIIVPQRKGDKVGSLNVAMADALHQHLAGPFSLKHQTNFSLGKPNSFLGYEIRRRAAKHGGYAKAVPSGPAINRFRRKTALRLALVPLKDHYDELHTACQRWTNSFGAWRGRKPGFSIAYTEAVDAMKPVRQFRAWLETTSPMADAQAIEVFKAKWLPAI